METMDNMSRADAAKIHRYVTAEGLAAEIRDLNGGSDNGHDNEEYRRGQVELAAAILGGGDDARGLIEGLLEKRVEDITEAEYAAFGKAVAVRFGSLMLCTNDAVRKALGAEAMEHIGVSIMNPRVEADAGIRKQWQEVLHGFRE